VLLERKAPVDIKDETWAVTPLAWALFGWRHPLPGGTPERYYETVRLLVAAGAKVEPAWLTSEDVKANPGMLRALHGEILAE
jgi:hypothetical protein